MTVERRGVTPHHPLLVPTPTRSSRFLLGQAHAAALAEAGRGSLARLSCPPTGFAQAASPARRGVSCGADEHGRQIGAARRALATGELGSLTPAVPLPER